MEEDSCQDRQDNEKAALLAIYGDQLKICQPDNISVWIPLECILTLYPLSSQISERKTGPSVNLHIICSQDYPNSVPSIELEEPKRLSHNDIHSLRKELLNLASDLKGEVMIFELAQHVENALCSYNRPQYESFYEEMISRQKKNLEIELERQAVEMEKMKDIKLKIQSEQQAVKRALRKKSTTCDYIPQHLIKSSHRPLRKRITSLVQHKHTEHPLTKQDDPEIPDDIISNIECRNGGDCLSLPWDFPNSQPNNHSRFQTEFEHINWLGKGAFGDVIKVRNKLDDGLYAIKRIELNPHKKQLNKKIIREVKLLSRLNHENVVRYYNSWIEMALPAQNSQLNNISESAESNQDSNKNVREDDIIPVQNRISWTLDKPGESSSDSSDDSWIEFRSGSKSEDQLADTIVPKTSSKENTLRSEILPITLLHLYIQMEFCEKSTLRNAIDEGLCSDMERIWRLFREIVEGLYHIHQQGIIHRDLKPVNIFIGHDDHVKIGDFGLATTIVRQKQTASGTAESIYRSGSSVTVSSQTGKDVSQTGQVGTAFYVAPELNCSNLKALYNQKVDIYSLGIIFFEMCHPPFLTSMERAKILTDIRQEKPIFPPDFPYSDASDQHQLIRWMLEHDVQERPNSEEILQCEMVPPPQLEEAEVKEMVRRTLSNSRSKDYKFLIASCFNQEMPPTLDATFNVSSWRSNWFLSLSESICEVIRRIMRSHGAISFLPPLLTPANDPPECSVSLMTRLGSIVYATFDIRMPFVRFLTHNPSVCHLKRYAIDKVYKERPAGVHPKEVYECSFDIVTSNPGDLMPEFELIATAWEILSEFPTVLKKNTVLRLNHSSLVYAVFSYCGVDREKYCFEDILFKTKNEFYSKVDIESKLRSIGIADNIVSSIMNLIVFEGPFRDAVLLLDPLRSIDQVSQALNQLETLINYCQTLDITCPVLVSLYLFQNAHSYSGIMFQISYEQLSKRKQIKHVLISGGRYDKLIRESNRLFTNDEGKDQYVAGMVLSIDKLVTSFDDSEKPSSADILICSMGPLQITIDRLNLIRDLWKSGLKTVFDNSFKTIEEIQSFCQEMGVYFIVILKETEPGFARVRLTDRYTDKKVSYNELIEYLQRTKSKGTSESSSSNTSLMTKVRDSPLITFLLGEKLNPSVKRRYENQVMNVISGAIQRLSSSTKVEVLVLDVDKEALLLLSSCLDINASKQDLTDYMKRFPRHKKYVQKFSNYFDDIKRSHNMPVIILFSLQENLYKVLI